MAVHLVVVDNTKDWKVHYPDATVVAAKDYLSDPQYLKSKDVKIVNLCRSYRYLSIGYYCSLLAKARRHRILPAIGTLTDLSSKSIYGILTEDLGQLVAKSLGRAATQNTASFDMYVFFGMCEHKAMADLARQIFELFPAPLLKVEFKHRRAWQVASVKPIGLNSLPEDAEGFFVDALKTYLARPWRSPKTRSAWKYDLAILHNPQEKLPPSDNRALRRFIRVGKQHGVRVELIERKDYGKLAEFDALFIRETTSISHYTYRFAKKADSEGMVVIDDPDSIVKCTNKVYLAELLSVNKVPAPRTLVIQKDQLGLVAERIGFPVVLKIPDGSFSRGVFKAQNPDELREMAGKLFKDSELILAQEFVYTEFDWRIGILNRQPLYACQYFMCKNHWQIVKHGPKGNVDEGTFRTWRVEDAPAEIVRVALKAANLIGNGLYGVDVKQSDRGIAVIEVNDNPNLDAGVEDAELKDDLYSTIIKEFVRRIEARR